MFNESIRQVMLEVLKPVHSKLEDLDSRLPKVQENKYITKEKAAKILNVSTSTINNYLKQGKLNKFKFGDDSRRVYIKKDEIESFIEKGEILC